MDNPVIQQPSKLSALVLNMVLSKLIKDKDKHVLILTDVEVLGMTQRYVDLLQYKIKKLNEESKSNFGVNTQAPSDIIKKADSDNQTARTYEFPVIEETQLLQPADDKTKNDKSTSSTIPSQLEQNVNEHSVSEKSVSAKDPLSSSISPKQLNKGDSFSLSSGKVERPSNESAEIKSTPATSQPQSEPLKPGQTPASSAPVKPMPPMITAKFNLPNAKVGESYQQLIKGSDNFGREVKVIDMKIPDDLGLMFSADKKLVTGTPARSGDFKLSLRYEVVSGEKLSSEMILIVNPDPKSLWKVIEPDSTLPYSKLHTEGKCIQLDEVSQLVAASRRGRSHEHGGTFRDDDYFLDSNPVSGWSVIVVADGAGSAKYSREGSRIAVTTAGQSLTELLNSQKGHELAAALESTESDKLNKLGSEFHYIFHQICTSAVSAIEEAANNIGEQPRAFATTFLAAVVKAYEGQYFVASFWLGDGAIAIYEPNGVVKLMGSPDGGEYAGQTLFLDRSALSATSFSKRTKVSSFDNKSILFLMTDGVSDPFFETDNGLADATKWKKLWDEIEPKLKESNPEQALTDWLHFFVPGHHDDRTIALLNTSNSHTK